MNKSTKGAIAAAAAAVLLLGGAGSLAYWTAEGEVGGDTINSGTFTLTEVAPCADAEWTLDDGEDVSGDTFDPASDEIVPGDVLTKECDFTLTAIGKHLRAVPSVTTPATVGGTINPAGNVTVSGTFSDSVGDPITVVTDDNDQDVLTAKITMTFPLGGEDNTTQIKTAVLSNYKVTLTQDHN